MNELEKTRQKVVAIVTWEAILEDQKRNDSGCTFKEIGGGRVNSEVGAPSF